MAGGFTSNTPLLIEVVESTAHPSHTRLHAVCLDISDSGCRAKWPARAPLLGDTVRVTWNAGDGRSGDEPEWIAARVARIAALLFGALEVGLIFEVTDPVLRARIRAWPRAWLEDYREHLRSRHAA